MALYHQVYQLKRNPCEIPCPEDTSEETLIEILEMLKAHLQHRWGSAQLEEPRGRSVGTRITSMPAQVKFHAQTQMTCDNFGHSWDRQQESWEEALWVVRDAHCWVLAVVAMLEGHIECWAILSLMGGTEAKGKQAATSSQEVGGTQEAKAIQGAIEGLHQLVPKDSGCIPSRRLHWGCSQEVGGFTQPHATQEVGHLWGRPFKLWCGDNPKDHGWVTGHIDRWFLGSTGQIGCSLKRETSGDCPYWTPKWRNFWVERRQKMTLLCRSSHPNSPLTITMNGLHGEQSRLQCPPCGPNWQAPQAKEISAT